MSETRTAETLRASVGEEVRVAMARRRCTGARLAASIGRSEAYLSRRLTGAVSWDLDDLAAIADALYVDPADLLPARRKRVTRYLPDGQVVATVGAGERRPVRLRSPFGQSTRDDRARRPSTPLAV